MSELVAARVDEEVSKAIAYVAKEEKCDKSKVVRELLANAVKEKLLELALEKYAKRQVSMGRAAELARMPLADFLGLAAEKDISINYTIQDLEADLRALKKVR